jgi:localization factor PodJL
MSLNEWLEEAIDHYAQTAGVDPAELNEDDRIEAIAAQLQRLGISAERGEATQKQGQKMRSRRGSGADDALLEKAVARLERDMKPAAPRRAPVETELAQMGRSSASLGAAIAEISRRQRVLEDDDRAAALASAGSRSNRSRVRHALQWDNPSAGTSLESLHGDIAALASEIQSLRREQSERNAQPPAACNLDRLRSEIATMSDALRELGARGSIAPLEATILTLTKQIEASRNDGIRDALLQPLERLVSDLRLALAEADPRTTIRGLEGEVQKLGSKLAPVARIEQQLEALTQRFDHLRDFNGQHDASSRREENDLQAVAEELRLLGVDQAPPALAKIEGQLATIAAKIEEALAEARDESRYTALANRINDVHLELAERMSQGAPQIDIRSLETLVRSLAQKIEEAHGPQADSRAIEALQKQVSEFAARLDRANSGFPSLTSLEQSIGELFTELERTRDVSYAAAERAAQSVLDQTLAKPQSQEQPDIVHDLVEMRRVQDEAGRRTLSTLNAVHETLEKVVDRLAMVESEIADVRGQRQPELLASGPAPNFAPAPSRAVGRADRRGPNGVLPSAPPMPAPQTEMLDDFLIEPGRGFPGRDAPLSDNGERMQTRAPSAHQEAPEAASGHSGFIAAARRAAQAAQMESAAVIGAPSSRLGGIRDETPAGLIGQARHFISHYKRPVVLSVAALFLVMGAYAVVKTVGHAPGHDFPVGGGKEMPARSAPARLPVAPPRGAPMPAPAAAPKPSAALPSFIDPMATGSLGPAARAAPATGETSPAILQKLAEAGNAKAQYELATDYSIGSALPRDLRLAAQWYEKAAAQGLPPAQYRLGTLYEKGLGVRRDVALATAWYLKAAQQGNVRAMHNLAVLTAEGGDTGKPDYAAAAQWFRQAAEYGVRDSQYNVAILLARGLGVPQNLTLSYVWFAVAAAQGDEDAGKKRDDVGARLSPADLAAANATAAAFHAKAPNPEANEVTPPPGGWSAPTSNLTKARPKISRL